MANSVYQINKGINKSIEFKGLKAQYIWYLAAVVIGLLIVFAVLYIIGINQYICLAVIGGTGSFALRKIYSLSKKYGEHGLAKMIARKSIPRMLKSNNQSPFLKKPKIK